MRRRLNPGLKTSVQNNFSSGSPSLEHMGIYPRPSHRLSPRPRERGVCKALPGGWTDGKELAR